MSTRFEMTNTVAGVGGEADHTSWAVSALTNPAASFEALFFRQLQQVTTRIHDTDNLDQLLLEVSSDICNLFNADRMTLYAVNEDRTAIVSKN